MRWIYTIFLFALIMAGPELARAERVALLIGNSIYQNSSTLRNPINDTLAFEARLRVLGFDVERLENAERVTLGRALARFGRRAARAETAVVFYSGHGMEIAGRNYLIPTDASLEFPEDADFEAVPLAKVLEAAGRAKKLSVVIVDACRNNTFPSVERSGAKGFAAVDLSQPGQAIAFSTAPGTVAYDGTGSLSPYTQALTERLSERPHEDIRILLTSLGEATARYARRDQQPFARFGGMPPGLVSLGGEPPDLEAKDMSPEPVSALADECAGALWEIANEDASCLSYQTYREVCSENRRANFAQARMRALNCEQNNDSSTGPSAPAGSASLRPIEEELPSATTVWSKISSHRDPAIFEHFIETYPDAPERSPAETALSALLADFRSAQSELKRLGLYRGAIDGKFGQRSTAALIAFERQAALIEDGVLSDSDLAILKETPTPVLSEDSAKFEKFRDCTSCPEMIVVPGGAFVMGSESADLNPKWRDRPVAGPQRTVRVNSFAMGVYEVTFNEWSACVSDGYCGGVQPDDENGSNGLRPAVGVTWNDVMAPRGFIAWLNSKVGAQIYRLPSESEWEYAARGGTSTRFPWGDEWDPSKAHGAQKSKVSLNAFVGTYPPNNFGLYDMIGNAWELVQDCFNLTYSGAPQDGSAWMAGDCKNSIIRGGTTRGIAESLESSYRGVKPRSRTRIARAWRTVGFRVARSI